MSVAIEQSLSERLVEALAWFPLVKVEITDEDSYKRFRVLEPSLVGCLDDQTNTSDAVSDFIQVSCDDKPAGVVSLITRVNVRKPPMRALYGRVDLVIVDPRFRGLELGRVLTLVGVNYLLENNGSRLYSISCLAAHPAMEKILESIGFERHERVDTSFVHEEIVLQEDEVVDLTDWMFSETVCAVQRANFKIRQRQNEG